MPQHRPPDLSIMELAMVATLLSGTMEGCKPKFPLRCAWDAEWGRVSFTYPRRAVAIVGVPATKRMSLATTINWWFFPRMAHPA